MRQNTHTQKLERWIGSAALQQLHEASRLIPIPVAVANVPGEIYAYRGEFYGAIRGGAGFSSLSDLINEVTVNGKGQPFFFYKTSSTGGTGQYVSMWNSGTFPYAGGAPTAIATGAVPNNTTAGAFPTVNAAGGDTMHFLNMLAWSTVNQAVLLLYDRIFHAGSVQHNTTAGQSVTGVPTRYATTGTAPGNFAFLEVTTQLGATAHTLTLTYVDDAGNTAEAAPALTMVTGAAVNRVPHTPYFVPLNSADLGVTNVTNIAFSAVSSGVSNIVIGHPIALVPIPAANSPVILDGINTAFNFMRIYDNACLALLQINGAATTYQGMLYVATG